MIPASRFFTKAIQAIAVLLVAAVFVGLGIWQLQRAADLKDSLKVATTIDTNVVPLETVTAPRQSLPATAINKIKISELQTKLMEMGSKLIGKLHYFKSIPTQPFWLSAGCGRSV